MNKRDRNMCLKFLNNNKELVGLHQWHIVVSFDNETINAYAEAEPTITEKTIKIVLSKALNSFTSSRIKSILMHELLHARFNIFEKEKDELIDSLEEGYINDLERGFMSLMDINTQAESLKVK